VLVHGRIGALDDDHFFVAHIFSDADLGFAVGEIRHFDREEFGAQFCREVGRELDGRGPRGNCPVQGSKRATTIFVDYKNR